MSRLSAHRAQTVTRFINVTAKISRFEVGSRACCLSLGVWRLGKIKFKSNVLWGVVLDDGTYCTVYDIEDLQSPGFIKRPT